MVRIRSNSSQGSWSFNRTRSSDQRSLTSSIESLALNPNESSDSDEEPAETRAMARRRRRHAKKKTADENKLYESEASRRKKKKDRKSRNDEDLDPYESDPGESYRQHCMRVQGLNTRSCLRMPKLLSRASSAAIEENNTISTSPPSPINSEMEDLSSQIPPSLPSDLARVRYSLRTAIGDGSSKQPRGPSVMDRRELRPNGVQLNVSHWSDSGARSYMEDR